MSDDSSPAINFHPIAFLLAILLPGAGHVARGERARGLWAGAGVLGLFVGGILIGGIDVIDSREDRVPFFGQALVGPIAFGIDSYHQNRLKVIDPLKRTPRSAFPDEGRDPVTRAPIPGGTPPNKKSIGKVNELGTLFTGVAGMLNLIIIIDAAFPTRRRKAAAAAPKGDA